MQCSRFIINFVSIHHLMGRSGQNKKERMKEQRINIWIIIVGAVIVALLCVWLLLILMGDGENMREVILNYGFVTTPILLIWLWMNYWGWHTGLMQNSYVRNYLGLPPDLRGRWEGTIDRKGEHNPHPFVIEIKQTMNSIQIYSYSSRGKSDSITHSFVCDALGGNETLCFHWRGKHGRRASESSEDNMFYGFTSCCHKKNVDGRFLEGDYFTNRQPEQTMGKIKLRFEGLELKCEF